MTETNRGKNERGIPVTQAEDRVPAHCSRARPCFQSIQDERVLLSRAFDSSSTALTLSQSSKPSPVNDLIAPQREVPASSRDGMRSAIIRAAAKHSVVIACAKPLGRRGTVEERLGLGANNGASDGATRCRRIRFGLSC